MPRQTVLFYLCAAMIVLTGCERSGDIRHYTEITRQPPEAPKSDPHAGLDMSAMMPGMQPKDPAMQEMLDRSVAKVDLQWKTPSGWNEQPGTGMRLATLTSAEEDPVTCTLISLAGVSGGIEANVQRWAGQLNLSLDAAAVAEFLANQKEISAQGGLKVPVLDFRALQSGAADDAPSMTAAVLSLPGKSIYIKMTGSRAAVTRNQESFTALLQSLSVPSSK